MSTIPEDRASAAPSSAEVSRALRHCWQPVARIEELKHGPQRAVLLGEALAVFLTEDGEPAVLADRCAHRGASLAMGRVTGESLQCPYHGWEWAGTDGVCTRIPSLADQALIPRQARIRAFPARQQWGLVWTVLGEPLAGLPTVPWFDEEKWIWGHGPPFELPVGLGLMIENFRDIAHFSFVHRNTLGAIPEVVEPLEPERDGFTVHLRREMTVGAGGEELYGAAPEVRYLTVAPNLTSAHILTDKGERGLIHISRAIGPNESMHYWIQVLGAGFEERDLEKAIEFEASVYAEDRRILSAVEPPELSLDRGGEFSTLSDRYTLAYRQAFADFVRAACAWQRA